MEYPTPTVTTPAPPTVADQVKAAVAKAMAQVKTPELPPWNGKSVTETFCHVCGGMVNGNGCDKPVCPVRA